MTNSFHFRKTIRWLVLGFSVGVQLSNVVRADIYVSDWTTPTGGAEGKIGLYSDLGAPITSLAPGLMQPHFLARDSGGIIYVTSFSYGSGVGAYNPSGVPVNVSLISGMDWPMGVAVDNGLIYVTDWYDSKVSVYTTSGTLVNASLITGLHAPNGIAADGQGHLFVANQSTGTIGLYSTSGATLNAALISGLNNPADVQLDGAGNLYVSSKGSSTADGRIGKYTTAGATINAALVTGLPSPLGMTLMGNGDLLVVNSGNNTVGEYRPSGAVVNAALMTVGHGFDVLWVPEPSSAAILLSATVFGMLRRRMRAEKRKISDA